MSDKYYLVHRTTGTLTTSEFPATGVFEHFTDRELAYAFSKKLQSQLFKEPSRTYYLVDRRTGEISVSDHEPRGPYTVRLSMNAARRVAIGVKLRNLKAKADEYNAALEEYLSGGGANPDRFKPATWKT